MKKELGVILRDSFNELAGCKHLPCPDTGGCRECAINRILALFADKVRQLDRLERRIHNTVEPRLR